MGKTKGIDWAIECPRILELRKSGVSSADIARDYGINADTLGKWVRHYGHTLAVNRTPLSKAELRQKAVEKAARYARTVATRQRNARVRKAAFSGMMPFSVIRRIDRLIADGWGFPRAYHAITTGKA